MKKGIQIVCWFLLTGLAAFSQQFEMVPADVISGGSKPFRFGNILCTTKGTVLIACSTGLAEMDGMEIYVPAYNGYPTGPRGKKEFLGKRLNIYKDVYEVYAGIKLICEGPDKIIYIVSNNNNFGCFDHKLGRSIMFPPFNFPSTANQQTEIRNIWIDQEGSLFVATGSDTIYVVERATDIIKPNTGKKVKATYVWGLDNDSNMIVKEGSRSIKKISLGPGILPYSFGRDPLEKRIILIGTNKGLFGYDKQSGQQIHYLKPETNASLTITDLEPGKFGIIIWFSTLEKGMGSFNTYTKRVTFSSYPEDIEAGKKAIHPIRSFSRKSPNEFFVAMTDTLPAVFNTETGKYTFINDSIFSSTENKTTDIRADAFGNLYITKGGGFFWSKNYIRNVPVGHIDSSFYGPYITDILLNGKQYDTQKGFFGRDESLKEIKLKHDENNIQIFYSCRGLGSDSLVFAWNLDNFSDEWVTVPYTILDNEMNVASLDNLRPGEYIFRLKVRKGTGDWLKKQASLKIIISPPYWQAWWFWLSIATGAGVLGFSTVKWRVNMVRKQERIKAKYEKEALELEARALRAQMNPHFIFNCMNSIKSLIQQKDDDKAVNYLTTFSKLLRTVLQNGDKREITLYDEIETCRLYTQLESMRFGSRFCYQFCVDEEIDLKSVRVPALIIQPFIENAIWHGIMPKDKDGSLAISVKRENDIIYCLVDDNGIGRETSRKNKFDADASAHQSRGMNLTQSRLDLDNFLNNRNATIEIVDKTDGHGRPAGTTVILGFKEY